MNPADSEGYIKNLMRIPIKEISTRQFNYLCAQSAARGGGGSYADRTRKLHPKKLEASTARRSELT